MKTSLEHPPKQKELAEIVEIIRNGAGSFSFERYWKFIPEVGFEKKG